MPGRGCHTRRQGCSDTVTRRCRGKETVRTTRPGNRAARPIPRSPTTGPNHPSSRAVRNRRSAPPPQIQPLRGQKSVGCRPIHTASGFLTLSAYGRKGSTRFVLDTGGPRHPYQASDGRRESHAGSTFPPLPPELSPPEPEARNRKRWIRTGSSTETNRQQSSTTETSRQQSSTTGYTETENKPALTSPARVWIFRTQGTLFPKKTYLCPEPDPDRDVPFPN